MRAVVLRLDDALSLLGAHGLLEENEDMRAVVMRLDDALSLLVKGGINNFTTVAALQSLALRLGRKAFA